MRSIRAKILIFCVCGIVLIELITVAAILLHSRFQSETSTVSTLNRGTDVVNKFVAARANSMTQMGTTLSEDPRFKKVVSMGGSNAMRAMLLDNLGRLSVDAVLMINPEGEVVASTIGASLDAYPVFDTTVFGPGMMTIVANKRGYETVTLPVTANDSGALLGYLMLSSQLDRELAFQISGITGLDVSFVARADTGGMFLASSLNEQDLNLMQATARMIQAGATPEEANEKIRDRFISRRAAFGDNSALVYVLLHEKFDRAMAAYTDLFGFIIRLVAVSVIAVFILVWWLSMRISRPLSLLSESARRMTVGDYSRKVDVAKISKNDELASLAEAFNHMQEGIQQREREMEKQSLTDHVTKLPNRPHSMILLRKLIGSGRDVAVILVDLGRYEHIRSTLGQAVADQMLCISADRMSRCLPDEAMLARLEADEFLVVLPVSGVDSAINEAESLYSLLESGLNINDARISLDVHMGVAVYPEHGKNCDELLSRASLAMVEATRSRGRLRVFTQIKEEAHGRRLKILGDLRVAIEEEQLELFVQPKFAIEHGDVVGVECLVRWNHPELGSIPPDEFIQLAEETGTVSQVTRWVLAEATRHCADWLQQGVDVPVAVNLSIQDLHNENLPYEIDELLKKNGLEPRHLSVEITEAAVSQDLGRACEVLLALEERGIRSAMDDFGTGYSSLHQLKELPIQEIKIDRAFVSNLPEDKADVAIVRAATDIAISLGLTVVAEGVETERAWCFLNRLGCQYAQGFLAAKPMPADDFVDWKQRSVAPSYNDIDAAMMIQFAGHARNT